MGIKRLFIDIETSPNLVTSWRVGRKITLDSKNIVAERSMISVSYKWEGEDKIYSVWWDKNQNDKRVAARAAKVIQEADEVVAHNGDHFDVKWIRTRCLHHGIPFPPKIVTHDTCKLARRYFYFNENRLDYIAHILGFGHKLDTDYGLWKKVCLQNDRKALKYMVEYCERDVDLLEEVWKKLSPYVPSKTHIDGLPRHCPECGSEHTVVRKRRTTAAGYRQVQMQCMDCNKYHTVAATRFEKNQ